MFPGEDETLVGKAMKYDISANRWSTIDINFNVGSVVQHRVLSALLRILVHLFHFLLSLSVISMVLARQPPEIARFQMVLCCSPAPCSSFGD